MALPEAISKLVKTAEKLEASGAGNEANTKVLMIEPLMAALGWDPTDLDAVQREVKVFDGTFLDYALKSGGQPRLYVEAKGLQEQLNDNKFIAQTVNYANNDGVVWCVLTNGRHLRVYKTNEPVSMDRKLLFEVDLTDESESVGDKAKTLRLISREAVDAGELDRFGERVFTDTRIRKVLSDLAADPPPGFLKMVGEGLGHPTVPPEAMKRSLARILDAPSSTPVTSGPAGSAGSSTATESVGLPSPPKGQEYSVEHHVGNKSAVIKELFDEVNAFALSLGGDVTRRLRKQYVGYFRGKRSFFTIELQHQRAIIYLGLDPTHLKPWNEDAMRDVRNVGHFGMGDTEYSLKNVDQLHEVKELIQTSYDAHG